MTRDLVKELDALKQDVAVLRQQAQDATRPHLASAIASEFVDLRGLVEDILKHAEGDMSDHPIAAVAGSLALGILIGRMLAR